MATNSIQYVYEIIDRYTPTLQRIQRQQAKFSESVKKSTARLKSLQNRMKTVGSSAKKMGRDLSLKLTLPLIALGAIAIKSASELEDLRTAFTGILGSGEKAAALVEQLNEFTARTPFQLDQVSRSANQLLATKMFSTNDIQDKLQVLGDVAAAANIPISDMTQIFAKAANKGKVMTEELLQLSDRGIPIIAVLAEQLDKTKDKIFELASQSKIGFDTLEKALVKMTSKGGFAFEAMILKSRTLSGVFSTLKDNFKFAAAELGDVMLPALKKFALASIKAFQAFIKFSKDNPRIVKIILAISAILAALGPLLITLGFVAIAFAALNAPIIIAAVAVTALVALAILLALKWDKVKKSFRDISGIVKSTLAFQVLAKVFRFIKDEIKATIDLISSFIEAITKLITKIGQIPAIKGLGEAAGDIFGSSADNLFKNIAVGGIGGASGTVTVDVNLKAPKDTVESTKVTKEGKGLNAGLNMRSSA